MQPTATQESGLGAKNLELAEAKDELQKGLEAVPCGTGCDTHVTCGRPSRYKLIYNMNVKIK